MVKLGIICAMAEELQTLIAELDVVQETRYAKQTYYSGTIKGTSVVLVQSGIGKVQMGMTAAIMLAVFAPDALINTGSAGGIGAGLAIGDVVISDAVAYHDVDVTAFDHLPGQLPEQPQRFMADHKLVQALQEAAMQVDLPNRVGLIVSGDQFVASQAGIDHILALYPDALATEMEGAAIGQVAYQFGVPFVVIRAMSDVGDDAASVAFDEFVVQAGHKSAAMVLAYLEQLS